MDPMPHLSQPLTASSAPPMQTETPSQRLLSLLSLHREHQGSLAILDILCPGEARSRRFPITGLKVPDEAKLATPGSRPPLSMDVRFDVTHRPALQELIDVCASSDDDAPRILKEAMILLHSGLTNNVHGMYRAENLNAHLIGIDTDAAPRLTLRHVGGSTFELHLSLLGGLADVVLA